jgi:SAM-dependent methyltransferase
MSKEMWDSRYSAEEYAYGKEPNTFFREQLETLKPGRILLPAEGEGRNAVFAAIRGWEVLAFDQSAEGRRKALKLAEEAGVAIRYELGDLAEISLQEDYFDVVALIFVHQPPAARRAFHQRVAGCLKKGGRIILEFYTKEQLKYNSGGPKDPELLANPDDLAEDFRGLEILTNQSHIIWHEEGIMHAGEASVVRLIAEKR